MESRTEEFVYALEPGGHGVPPFIFAAGVADRIEVTTGTWLLSREEVLEREGGAEALAKFEACDISDHFTYERALNDAIEAVADAEDHLKSFYPDKEEAV